MGGTLKLKKYENRFQIYLFIEIVNNYIFLGKCDFKMHKKVMVSSGLKALGLKNYVFHGHAWKQS